MKFFINKDGDLLRGEAFLNCGNAKREELREEFRELTLVEMFKMADQTNTWDELDEEFYQEMANEAGLDFNSYSDLQDLMDDLESEMKEGEEVKTNFKHIGYWGENKNIEI